jgi:hypothetical protein
VDAHRTGRPLVEPDGRLARQSEGGPRPIRSAALLRLSSSRRSGARSFVGRGAYGIRTRATAVRGRRPRPLDECAVPGQSSRSVKNIGLVAREVGPPTSPLRSLPTENRRAFVRRADCADSRMRLQGQKEARRPAARTPSLPFVPESFRRAPLTRRVPKGLGNRTLISHGARARQRARVEGLPSPKFGVAVGADALLEAPAPGWKGRVLRPDATIP